MDTYRQLLFFFSALGAFNSALLSIYFFIFAKPKNVSNYLLGGLLASLSIRIWKSLFYYFNHDIEKIYLQIGLSACFFIGPFLFMFVQSKLKNTKSLINQWKYHLVILLIIIVGLGLLYPYKTNILFWRKFMLKFIYAEWVLYIMASAYLMRNIFPKLFSKTNKVTYNDYWLLSVFFSVVIVYLAYVTNYYTSYIVGALSFSTVFYLSITIIYLKKNESNTLKTIKKKYASNTISIADAKKLLFKLDDIIVSKELYKNPNLTLPFLAKEVKVSSHLLSQLLNDNLNKNFSLFINEYRIEEAKKVLNKGSNLTMEALAETCGFNSNSTFYSAFKKIEETTPAKYLIAIQQDRPPDL